MRFHFPQAFYMSHPSQASSFDNPNNIIIVSVAAAAAVVDCGIFHGLIRLLGS
jgi:hypothetical protein